MTVMFRVDSSLDKIDEIDAVGIGCIVVVRSVINSVGLYGSEDFEDDTVIARIYKGEPMFVLETCEDPLSMIVTFGKITWIRVLSSHGTGFVKWALTRRLDKPDFESP